MGYWSETHLRSCSTSSKVGIFSSSDLLYNLTRKTFVFLLFTAQTSLNPPLFPLPPHPLMRVLKSVNFEEEYRIVWWISKSGTRLISHSRYCSISFSSSLPLHFFWRCLTSFLKHQHFWNSIIQRPFSFFLPARLPWFSVLPVSPQSLSLL